MIEWTWTSWAPSQLSMRALLKVGLLEHRAIWITFSIECPTYELHHHLALSVLPAQLVRSEKARMVSASANVILYQKITHPKIRASVVVSVGVLGKRAGFQ